MRTNRALRIGTAMGLLLSVLGCPRLTGNDTCVGSSPAAVIVTVTDASTGRPPTTTTSLLVEAGGRAVGSSSAVSVDPLRIASNGTGRAGTFRLTIRAAGYADAVVPSVVVTAPGRCAFVKTETLAIALVPQL